MRHMPGSTLAEAETDQQQRPYCVCGHRHADPVRYGLCMHKQAKRTGARWINPNSAHRPISDAAGHRLTQAASPEIMKQLKSSSDPSQIAQLILTDCRDSGKLFHRTVSRWRAGIDPTELMSLTDFAYPRYAYRADADVAEALMKRYPSVLSTTDADVKTTDSVSRRYTAVAVVSLLSSQPDQIPVLDFTAAQLNPQLPFPWVGTRRQWEQMLQYSLGAQTVR